VAPPSSPNKGGNLESAYFMCCFQLVCFVNSCESERTATKVMIMGVMAWHQTQKLM